MDYDIHIDSKSNGEIPKMTSLFLVELSKLQSEFVESILGVELSTNQTNPSLHILNEEQCQQVISHINEMSDEIFELNEHLIGDLLLRLV